MNKLYINLCNNTQTGLNYTLSNIKNYINDMSFNNIIVVPDKLSLYTEQKVFELLDIPVYFNLSVMGISKLANKIISENNIQYIQCTDLEAKLLTLIAIQNTCNNFKCFSKKYNLGLVDEIYAKIEQIKSSNCKIDDLIDENANEGTKLKFEDIKSIYNEFENLKGNKLDGSALLNLYNTICHKSQSLKRTNFFFVGFESITKQGIQILKNTILNSNHTEISITAPLKQNNNSKIYDQSLYKSILNLYEENNFDIKIIDNISTSFSANKIEILNNLFSRKNKFNNTNNYFSIHKSTSLISEISNCVKQINFLLKNENLNFKDIAICAPKDIHQFLESELNNIGIDTFFNKKLSLFEYEPIYYLFNILKYVLLSKNKLSLINIVHNNLCNLSIEDKNTLLDLINRYSSLKIILNKQNNLNKNVLNFINQLEEFEPSQLLNLNNLITFLKKIIEKYNIFEKINEICENFKNIGETALEKSYLQISDKLTTVLNSLQELPIKQNMTNSELLDILEKALRETTILDIPSTINQLFIGDTTDYYFDKKYIFMLCMNEGITPHILLDTGLISDKEILSETIKAKLEPTTNIINKRTKFKTFEILLSAETKCILSYHSQNSDNQQLQPSDIISELKFLYGNQETTDEDFILYNDNTETKLAYNLIDNYNANLTLRTITDNNLQMLIKNTLIKNNSLAFKPLQSKVDTDYTKLFFKNNKTSISVIEQYNKCPKSAFYGNALKLTEPTSDKIEVNVVGNFIHQIGEHFVAENKPNLGQLTPQEIETSVNKICIDTLKDEKYFTISLEKNKFILKILIQECIRFCEFINLEQQNSHFKATHEELYFGPKSNFKPIEIMFNNKKYIITGYIDRVDEHSNYFRIIDYKTGNTTNSKGKDLLYYGTKIQLFVYADAVRQNLNKKLFGAFYLPIKNSFSTDGVNTYHLSGFFINDFNLIKLCDVNLSANQPNILKCTVNPNGQSVRRTHNILTEAQLDAYIKYSIEMVKQTILNIESGFIDCSPIKSSNNCSCDRCNFNKICKMANNENIIRKENYNITNDNFLEFNYD